MNTITAHLAALAAEWQRSDDPYSMLLTADRALRGAYHNPRSPPTASSSPWATRLIVTTTTGDVFGHDVSCGDVLAW